MGTTTIADIPQEILTVVFGLMKDRLQDLSQCQRTCKKWCPLAQQELYEKIDIFSFNEKQTALFFITVASTSDSGPGELVKKLNLDTIFSKSIHHKHDSQYAVYLEHLQRLFPNVEDLNAYDNSSLFWLNLIHERNSGNWQQLKKIPPPYYDFAAYAYAALACSNTLEQLLLCCLPTTIGSTPGNLSIQFNKLTKNLRSFIKLKVLYIEVVSGAQNDLSRFDDIIDSFPQSLDTLNFNDVSGGPGNLPYNLLSRANSLDTVQPSETVKRLVVEQCQFNQVSAKYIMVKFPKLQSMFLSQVWETFENLSKKIKLDFFSFISRLEKFELIGDIVDKDNLLLEMASVFMEATSISADDTMNVKLVYHRLSHMDEYGDGYMEEENYVPTLVIRNCNKSSTPFIGDHKTWAVNNRKIKKSVSLDMRFTDTIKKSPDLYKTFLKAHGPKIDQLYFSPSSEESPILMYNGGNDAHPMGTMVSCLDRIFEDCPKLNNLLLNWMKLYKSNKKKPTINKSITSLELNYCLILPGVLRELSDRLPALKKLYLRTCLFPEKGKTDREIDIAYNNCIDINTPKTSFDTVTWCIEDYTSQEFYLCWNSGISYVKITTYPDTNDNKKGGKVKYFSINKNEGVKETSQAKYKDSVYHTGCFTFDIHCKKISCFAIKVIDSPNHYVYLDDD